jgi:hypothetical protein
MGKPFRKKSAEQGHSILEFALVAIPTVVMLLSVVIIGINLGRSVQAGQICRDADSMFVRGVDFSQTGARQMLAHLGAGLNLQTSGGSGVVILSKFQSVLVVPTCTGTGCAYKNVLAQRLTIGNTSLTGGSTRFPTAGTVTPTADGGIPNYSTDANAVVTNLPAALSLNAGEVSYVLEAYFQTTATDIQVWETSPGIYAQAFF